MSIRERDAAADEGWVDLAPLTLCADRRALRIAGDALAATVRAWHPVSPIYGAGGVVVRVWCDGCDAPESECWAALPLAAWEEAADA